MTYRSSEQRNTAGLLASLAVGAFLWAGQGLAAEPVPDPRQLVFDTPDAAERGRAGMARSLRGTERTMAERMRMGGGPDQPTVAAEEYQQSVRDLESQGAWAPGLGEDLLGLGRALQAMGEHQEAIPVFERASHVVRVNRGLHTLDQLPALEERIASHIALGQWEEADRQQQYSFYLHSRSMTPDDPAMIEALRHFAYWNLSVHFRGMEETPARLIDAYRLLNSAHDLLVEQRPAALEEQLVYLDALAGVAWLVARTHIDDDPELRRGDRAFGEAALVSFTGRSRSLYRINGFVQGESALQRAVDLHVERMESGEGSVLETAEALLRLGDWYLLFDRRQASSETYRRAWELVETRAPDQLERLFDTVRVLPRFESFEEQRRFARQGRMAAGQERGHVDVGMDVNRYGRVGDLDVMGGDPESIEEVAMSLRRNLRDMRLRPRVEDGETVDTPDIVLRLPYWY